MTETEAVRNMVLFLQGGRGGEELSLPTSENAVFNFTGTIQVTFTMY